MKAYMSPYGRFYDNPFNVKLSNALSTKDVDVEEISIIKNYRNDFICKGNSICEADILHLHWPDKQIFLNDNRKGYQKDLPNNQDILRSMDNFFSLITYCKKNDIKIVWTVHDLQPIEEDYSEMEIFFWNQFADKVDGIAGMGSKGPEKAKKRFPELEGVPYYDMPHGSYKGCYPEPYGTLVEPDESKKTFLCFGQLREKKGLLNLVNIFPDEYQLIIAGNPVFRHIGRKDKEFITRLKMLANRKENIFIYPFYISRVDVSKFLNFCDYGVLPYQDFLYSGSFFLMLSYEIPVLASKQGSFLRLSKKFGDCVYTENLTKDSFKRAEENLYKEPVSFRRWGSIAEELKEFYGEII